MNGVDGKYLMFRGKPMMRQGNTICYGSMNDKYILFLGIINTKKQEGTTEECGEVPDNILVQILSTDTGKPLQERMVKQFTKKGLYDALEIGLFWLEKFNSDKQA